MITVQGEDHKLGLALSGGGFRASIFHMGVLKRLDELGVLSKVDVISTVSGGAIVGAYYVHQMSLGQSLSQIEPEFRKILKANVRLRGLTGSIAFHPIRFVRAVFPGYTRTNTVAAEYDRLLFRGATLQDLPSRPKLVINATSLNTGQVWKFSRDVMGDYRYGTVREPSVKLCDAVGASAAVPGLFPPLILESKQLLSVTPPAANILDESHEPLHVKQLALSDGGVRDNQGIQSILSEGCGYIIVSDASGLIDAAPSPSTLAVKVLLRSSSITMDAARDLMVSKVFEQKKLNNIRQIVFFDMEDQATASPGLPSSLRKLSAQVRTDLDWFSDEEIETIKYHGYTLLDQKLRKYGSDLLGNNPPKLSWEIDYSSRTKVNAIEAAMAKSHKRRIRPYKFH